MQKTDTSPARSIRVGAYEAVAVRDAPFGIDAGTMFHMVPRILWQRHVTPDERHRMFIGINCLLLRGEGRTILYDAGVGDKLSEKHRHIYGLDPAVSLLSSLRQAGVRPEDVDTVIPSHLHIDHAGWLTVRKPDGALAPTFPHARYVVQRAEWEAARETNEVTTASYVPDNFLPLEKSGQMDLVNGPVAVTGAVRVERTGAHTPGHQILRVESGGAILLAACELIPTVWHLRVPWMTCFDQEPLRVLEIKKRLLRSAADGNWTVFLSHDPTRFFVRVRPLSAKEYAWDPAG